MAWRITAAASPSRVVLRAAPSRRTNGLRTWLASLRSLVAADVHAIKNADGLQALGGSARLCELNSLDIGSRTDVGTCPHARADGRTSRSRAATAVCICQMQLRRSRQRIAQPRSSSRRFAVRGSGEFVDQVPYGHQPSLPVSVSSAASVLLMMSRQTQRHSGCSSE